MRVDVDEPYLSTEEARRILHVGRTHMSAIKRAMGIRGHRVFLSSVKTWLRKHPDFTETQVYRRQPSIVKNNQTDYDNLRRLTSNKSSMQPKNPATKAKLLQPSTSRKRRNPTITFQLPLEMLNRINEECMSRSITRTRLIINCLAQNLDCHYKKRDTRGPALFQHLHPLSVQTGQQSPIIHQEPSSAYQQQI